MSLPSYGCIPSLGFFLKVPLNIALCTVNTPRVLLQMTKETPAPLPIKINPAHGFCQTWIVVAIHEFVEGGTTVKVWFCQTQADLLKQFPAFGSCQDPKYVWRLSLVFPLVAEPKWNGNPSALEAFSPNASKLSLVRANLHGPNTFLTFLLLGTGKRTVPTATRLRFKHKSQSAKSGTGGTGSWVSCTELYI